MSVRCLRSLMTIKLKSLHLVLAQGTYLLSLTYSFRLFELYAYLAPLGRFFPGGTCPSVGLSGFILGGGYGWFSRALGMGSDNVVELEVVCMLIMCSYITGP